MFIHDIKGLPIGRRVTFITSGCDNLCANSMYCFSLQSILLKVPIQVGKQNFCNETSAFSLNLLKDDRDDLSVFGPHLILISYVTITFTCIEIFIH